MLVSYEWLKDYVDISESPEGLAVLLTRIGLAVENIHGEGNDAVLEVEVTTNRPDCLGHIGVAREIALTTGREFRMPPLDYEETSEDVKSLAKLTVESKDLCPRYTARVIRGVQIKESPEWMKRRLTLVGLRPINNVVDATNYVLYEFSQPLHAFDYELINDHHVVVRRSRDKELMVLLDSRQIHLAEGACVIADPVEAIALAGIMGGANSEINSSTKDVLVESAQFAPKSIRRTARAVGASTDASYRFERGVDPIGVDTASRRAVRLIIETAGGKAVKGVLDSNPKPFKPDRTKVTISGIKRILGMDVDAKKVNCVLQGLGCSVKASGKNAWSVENPSWRPDLTREADYIEEIIRVIGYDEVPARVGLKVFPVKRSPELRAETMVREYLLAAGFNEVLTDSFLTNKEDGIFLPWGAPKPLRVMNPVREGQDVMRRSLTPSLLNTCRHNLNHGTENVSIYEVTRVYLSREGQLPVEEVVVGILSTDGFRVVKGAAEGLFDRLHAPQPVWQAEDFAGLALGESLIARANGATIGVIGAVAPEILQQFDLKKPAAVAEIRLQVLVDGMMEPDFQTPPRFPSIVRDVAVVVDENLRWEAVEKAARDAAPPLLPEIRFIEVYRGKQTGAGKKSFAFTMVYRSPDRTLTDDEVNTAHAAFLGKFLPAVSGALRA